MAIQKTVKALTVTKVEPNKFKSNLNQAELRQTIEKVYPSAHVGNNMQDAFAPLLAYKIDNQVYTEERVTWVDIPKDWTIDDVKAQLANMPGACIYRVLSSEVIMTDNDYSYMDSLSEDMREEFIERKKNSQYVINPETGEILTHNGKPFFRKLFFSAAPKADVDLRAGRISVIEKETTKEEQQVTEEVKQEEVQEPAVQAVSDEEDYTF
jgi:hypothetical protein